MVRVNVTIDERLLRAIDTRAKKEGRTRSEFLRHAVDEYFAQEAAKERRRRAMEKAIAIQDRIRAKTRPWDAVGFLRRDRASHR
ncbi:MAG: ribbon-helix-helix protein, CopG family [Candidatus Methylomirabilales bacterium]